MSQPASSPSSAAQLPADGLSPSAASARRRKPRTVPDLSVICNSHCPAIARALVRVMELSDNADWVEECFQLLGLENVTDMQLVANELTSILQHSVDPTGAPVPPQSDSAPAVDAANNNSQRVQQQEEMWGVATHAVSQPLPPSASEAEEWMASSPGAAADAGISNEARQHEADYSDLFARIDIALNNTHQLSQPHTQQPQQPPQPVSVSVIEQPANKRARISSQQQPSSQQPRSSQQQQQQQHPQRPPAAPGLLSQLHRLHIEETDAASGVSVSLSVMRSDVSTVQLLQRADDVDEEMEELRRCGLLS